MEGNLGQILAVRAQEMAGETAIVEPLWPSAMRRVSFAALEEDTRHFVGLFRRAGLRPGDPVLVLVPVSASLYAVLAAIFRSGLTAVFLDPSAGREHVARCCSLVPPRAVIRSPKAWLLDLVLPEVRRIPIKLTTLGARRFAAVGGEAGCGAATVAPDAAALITFTSGSTGLPKAAVRSHRFLWQQYLALREPMAYVAGELEVTTLPIFVLANLAAGVGTLIPPGDFRRPGSIAPEPVLRAIEAQRVQRITASPAFLERLVAWLESSGEHCETVRKVFTGGGPVFPALLGRAQAVFPKALVVAVYGSTEAEPIAEVEASAVLADDKVKMATGEGLLVGKPVSQIEVRVLKPRWGSPLGPLTAAEFAALGCPVGDAGEVVVAGGHVLPGYHGGVGDEETKVRVDGCIWHRTGDIGRFDSQGRVWLLGRASATIVDRQGTLYPFSLEVRLSFLPSLIRSAVIGDDDARVLFLHWREAPSGDERQQLRGMAEWAGIDRVIEGPIPVDARHNAKVNYPELRKRLRAGGAST